METPVDSFFTAFLAKSVVTRVQDAVEQYPQYIKQISKFPGECVLGEPGVTLPGGATSGRASHVDHETIDQLAFTFHNAIIFPNGQTAVVTDDGSGLRKLAAAVRAGDTATAKAIVDSLPSIMMQQSLDMTAFDRSKGKTDRWYDATEANNWAKKSNRAQRLVVLERSACTGSIRRGAWASSFQHFLENSLSSLMTVVHAYWYGTLPGGQLEHCDNDGVRYLVNSRGTSAAVTRAILSAADDMDDGPETDRFKSPSDAYLVPPPGEGGTHVLGLKWVERGGRVNCNLAAARPMLHAALGPRDPKRTILFYSRQKPANSRFITNEAAVVDVLKRWAERRGLEFDLLRDTESIKPSAALKRFYRAKIVFQLHGGGVFNAIAMHPDSIFIESRIGRKVAAKYLSCLVDNWAVPDTNPDNPLRTPKVPIAIGKLEELIAHLDRRDGFAPPA